MLKVATFGLDASSLAGAPLDHLVNNTLVKFISDSLDTLAQLINIVDLHLVHLLLKYRPDYKIVHCSVQYFVEIHELQTELSVFEARGVANFGTRCSFDTVLTTDAVTSFTH